MPLDDVVNLYRKWYLTTMSDAIMDIEYCTVYMNLFDSLLRYAGFLTLYVGIISIV